MTLCFVLCRFDFGVLTFNFRILRVFLRSVYDVVDFKRRNSRGRDKKSKKQSCEYFNAFIVYVMLIGNFCSR